MLYYRSFETNELLTAHKHQCEAYDNAIKHNNRSYNKDGYIFLLKKCNKFNAYVVVRDDGSLSGILSENKDFEIRSIRAEISTARYGSCETVNSHEGIAINDYIIEYAGFVVEIPKGSKIWYDENEQIIIGWHGTYSPPSGM
jgi:hypothetical protein